MRGPSGPWAATFDAAGRVDLFERRQGNGTVVWEGIPLDEDAPQPAGGAR